MQPRQVYVSTVTRRDRRWTRRRGRKRGLLGVAVLSTATLVGAFTALTTFAPGLT